MTTISTLLSKQANTSHDTYSAFQKGNVAFRFNKTNDAGLANAIHDALDINDSEKTLAIKSFPALFALAKRYLEGDDAAKIPPNYKYYQICLALIAGDEISSQRDRRDSLTALRQLESFYREYPVFNTTTPAGKTLQDLVDLRLKTNASFTGHTVVPSSQVSSQGEAKFMDSHHLVQPVELRNNLKAENSRRNYIKKHEVEPRVAGIEVFCGTLMELFIGKGQPTYKQEEKQSNGMVPILSEKIEFHRLSNTDYFQKWLATRFTHAAEIDVACIFLADDDYSLKNGGTRIDNGRPVRVDFDKMMAPVTLELVGLSEQPKKQTIKNVDYTIAGVSCVEGFNINAEDFNTLPLLPTKMPTVDIIKHHYVPRYWWVTEFVSEPDIYEKIVALQLDPAYQEAKFRAILEKIILPRDYIQALLDKIIFNESDSQRILHWVLGRQSQLKAVAEQILGFGAFVKAKGDRALEELKINLDNFILKRGDDFANVRSKQVAILKQYDTNLEKLRTCFKDHIFIETRPMSDQPIQNHTRVSDILDGLAVRMTKQAQKDFFIGQLAALNSHELDELSRFMDSVQQGNNVAHPFKLVRTERHPFFYSSGNTNTWVAMRHAVKAQMIAKLKENYSGHEKIILEAYSYHLFHHKLNQHNGRSFTRFGKTASCKEFEKTFECAKDNETPTIARSQRGLR